MAGRVAAVHTIQNVTRLVDCRGAVPAHGFHMAAAILRGVGQRGPVATERFARGLDQREPHALGCHRHKPPPLAA